MKTIQFKSNINCEACVSKVAPILNDNTDIQSWRVATDQPDKILTLEVSESIDLEELEYDIKKVGYTLTEL